MSFFQQMDTRRSPFIPTRRYPLRRHWQGTRPLGSAFVVILAVLFSLLFIFSALLAFANPSIGPHLRDDLNTIAGQDRGLVLLGESVDVDIDEPSVTIRWSTLGCGSGFILPESPKLHDSSACGIPSVPVDVFVGDSEAPIFSFNADSVPVIQESGQRVVYAVAPSLSVTVNLISHSIQEQIQFDQDITLDVHDTQLYPFDTYLVSTALRATGSNDSTTDTLLPIISIQVLEHMPSFSLSSYDTDIQISVDGQTILGRHIEIRIRRPAHARVYAILLFGINWALSHFSCGCALLAILQGPRLATMSALRLLTGALLVLLVIPQLRGVMPDAPGLDGVLIDTIGYFPQMTLAGISVIVLLLITLKHEMDRMDRIGGPSTHRTGHSVSYGRASGSRMLEMDCLPSRNVSTSDGMQRHRRNLSTREIILEQVMKVLDAGKQALRNNREIF